MYYAFTVETEKILYAHDIESTLKNNLPEVEIESVTTINHTKPKIVIINLKSEITEEQRQSINALISAAEEESGDQPIIN